jgi:hypothetical protein
MQKSQEARIRTLAHDLLAIVDRRDGKALKQSAALATVPAKRTRPAQPTSFVHEVAHGRTVMPMMPLEQAADRERILAHRAAMRENRADPLAGLNWDSTVAMRQFEAEERTRYAAASELLRRGVADGHVAASCHLEPEEVAGIREQIGL